MFELGQHQSPDVSWITHCMSVRDPGPDIVRDDVNSSRSRQIGRLQKRMQVACRSVEIITASRLVAFTETARVKYDNAPACADQQRQNFPPSNPALRPSRKQQHRVARPGCYVMEARAFDSHDMVLDLVSTGRVLGDGATGEYDASGDCGKQPDKRGHASSCVTATQARMVMRREPKPPRAISDQKLSASTIARANACGASWGRLCPMPPSTVRCAYSPENF